MAETTATVERPRDDKGRYVENPAATRDRRTDSPVELVRDERGIALFADLADRGITSNRLIADHLGCGEATVSRLKRDHQKPGPAFIACVARLYPGRLRRYFNFDARGQR